VQPERSHAAPEEEAVLSLTLVERHEQDAGARRLDALPAVRARAQLAVFHGLEVHEPGFHPEAVAGLDGMTVEELEHGRGSRAGGLEPRAVTGVLGQVSLDEQARRDEDRPQDRLVVVDGARIVVPAAFDADGDVALLAVVAEQGALDVLLEPEDDRELQAQRDAAVLEGVADEAEGRTFRGGRVQVEEQDLRPALREARLDLGQERALLASLAAVVPASFARDPHVILGPHAVQVAIDEPLTLRQGGGVAGEGEKRAAHLRLLPLERRQHPARRVDTRRFVAVQAAEDDDEDPGTPRGVAAEDALDRLRGGCFQGGLHGLVHDPRV